MLRALASKITWHKFTQQDKILHFKYSALILLALMLVFPLEAALLMTFLVGVAKEYWDYYYGSGFCFYDLFANVVGMGAALCVISLLQHVF
ncbi:MAG: hypothetical protein ACPG4U_07005 [Pseudomonadales bacterium]